MHQAQCSISSVYPRLTGPVSAALAAAAPPPLACVSSVGPPLPVLATTRGGVGVLVEHDFLLALEDQRALGAHHDFAVAAEAVAVDRRVGDDDLLVRILSYAGMPFFGFG